MPQAGGAAVGSDVGQQLGAVRAAERDGERRHALRLVAIDDQGNAAVGQARVDRVEQLRRSRDDRAIASRAGVPIHLVEQAVHRRAAVGVELDP